MAQSIDVFAAADKYEFGMGAWSKVLAPLFLQFVGGIKAGDQVLDVGCGTGSLAWTIAQTTNAAKIVGIDPSIGFVEYARARHSDPRVSFDIGNAQQLPYENGRFDKCLASLFITFVSDAPKAATEMRRVTEPGAVVATCMWDSQGGMECSIRFGAPPWRSTRKSKSILPDAVPTQPGKSCLIFAAAPDLIRWAPTR